jgi:deoxyribose-phosphate aldolase
MKLGENLRKCFLLSFLVVGNKALVKASGGVKSLVDATHMVQSGASRIGTSSGIAIIKETKATSDY